METKAPTTVDEVQQRARQARELLGNPMLAGAVAKLDDALILEWKTAKTVEAREAAWAKVNGLQRVMKELQITMEQGEHPGAILRRDSKL